MPYTYILRMDVVWATWGTSASDAVVATMVSQNKGFSALEAESSEVSHFEVIHQG